jgi:hypothetical protein
MNMDALSGALMVTAVAVIIRLRLMGLSSAWSVVRQRQHVIARLHGIRRNRITSSAAFTIAAAVLVVAVLAYVTGDLRTPFRIALAALALIAAAGVIRETIRER